MWGTSREMGNKWEIFVDNIMKLYQMTVSQWLGHFHIRWKILCSKGLHYWNCDQKCWWLFDNPCSCSSCLSSSKDIYQGQQWLVNNRLPPPPIKQLLWSHCRPFINMPSSLGHRCIKAVASSGMAAEFYENNIIAVPGENSQLCVIVALCRHHGLTTGS